MGVGVVSGVSGVGGVGPKRNRHNAVIVSDSSDDEDKTVPHQVFPRVIVHQAKNFFPNFQSPQPQQRQQQEQQFELHIQQLQTPEQYMQQLLQQQPSQSQFQQLQTPQEYLQVQQSSQLQSQHLR